MLLNRCCLLTWKICNNHHVCMGFFNVCCKCKIFFGEICFSIKWLGNILFSQAPAIKKNWVPVIHCIVYKYYISLQGSGNVFWLKNSANYWLLLKFKLLVYKVSQKNVSNVGIINMKILRNMQFVFRTTKNNLNFGSSSA